MSRLKFKQSRNPMQNLRWCARHSAFLLVLAVALWLSSPVETPGGAVGLTIVLVGAVFESGYSVGYLILAIFWSGRGKYPRLARHYEKFNPAIEDLDVWYQEALQEFKGMKIRSSAREFAFDGGAAEIVKIEKSGETTNPQRSRFSVTIYSRNAVGEYFFFLKNSTDKPYLRHMPKSVAKAVLSLD